MVKNIKFYSGVNKMNMICRINYVYVLFFKILMYDFDVVVRICVGDEIYIFFMKCRDWDILLFK